VKKAIPVAAALLLAACANSAISERYDGVEPVTVPMRGVFRVYDKPQDSLIMVTSPRGGSTYQAAGMYPNYSPAESRTPRPLYQQAAQKFLADAGRHACHITDGYPLASSAYEFTYACE
jgi:hypothetical protein